MNKKQATARIRASKCKSAYKDRAVLLIENPTLANQAAFGVCGMTAIIYILLCHRLDRFVAIFNTVFNKKSFISPTLGELKPINLLSTLEKEWETKFKKKGNLGKDAVAKANTDARLDFLLSRTLAHLLEYWPGGNAIVDMQREFSSSWKSWDETQGDLAITEECVDGMMVNLVGVDKIRQIQHFRMNFLDSIYKVNKVLQSSSKSKTPFVIAGVQKPNTLLKAQLTTTPYVRKRSDPEFSHWVVIRDIIKTKGNNYEIPVWSWAKNYTVNIKASVAKTWFHNFILGTMPR